jgi:hypothetical protein
MWMILRRATDDLGKPTMIKINIDDMIRRIERLEFEASIERGSFEEVIRQLRSPSIDWDTKRRLWAERVDVRTERHKHPTTKGAIVFKAILVPKGSDRAGMYDCTVNPPRKIEPVDHGRELERVHEDTNVTR